MGRNATFCENLYDPNPDIAGRGVLITFFAHTSCYIFLGLVIAPIVHKFLSQLTPDQLAAAPEHSSRDESSERSSEEASGSGDGARVRLPRSSEAIMAVFTGQYIVGLAYLVVAFIKHREMSYYHLRIIFGLCSINMDVALVSEYTRFSLLGQASRDRGESSSRTDHVRNWIRRIIDMPPRMSISSLGLVVLTVFYFAFIIYTSVMRGRDTNFQACFPVDKVLFPLTAVHSVGIFSIFLTSPGIFARYRMSTWAGYLLTSTVHVLFHYLQLIYIMRAFRGPTGRMNPELEFGFGQLLVFFMILQLFVEFGIGLWSDLDYLHRHMSAHGSSIPRSFVIFCSILVPMLPSKLRQEILQIWYSGPKRLVHKSKRGTLALLRRLSGWMHALSKRQLRKTKTVQAEAGPEDSLNQSLRNSVENGSNSDKASTSRTNSQERPSSDGSIEIITAPPTVPRLTL